MEKKDLGKVIKSGRKRKELTQSDLARLIGVNKQTIYAWDSGKYAPDGAILIALGNALDIVSQIFPGYTKESVLPGRGDFATREMPDVNFARKEQLERLEKKVENLEKKLSIIQVGNHHAIANSENIVVNEKS